MIFQAQLVAVRRKLDVGALMSPCFCDQSVARRRRGHGNSCCYLLETCQQLVAVRRKGDIISLSEGPCAAVYGAD